jgi:proteasome lid subunit RPN8/RPN11
MNSNHNHPDKLPPRRLKITPKALEKAETYAHLVAEEFGSPYESIGFLLTESERVGPDVVITDVMLAHDQSVSMGSAQISPSGMLTSGREIERKGKRCVGWWHAHPHNTYHSGTDDQNLQTVLEDVSVSNHWSLTERKRVSVHWVDGALMICTDTETIRITGEALAALQTNGSGNGVASGLQAEVQSDALTASAAYSLVVSATGKSRPYAEMATQTHCATCGQRETHAQKVNVELTDPDPLDCDALRKEVRRKVSNTHRHAKR